MRARILAQRLVLVFLLSLLWALPAVAQTGDICPEICRDEIDCPDDQICFPPTHTCQPVCEILCIVPDPVCGDDGVTYVCGEADANCHGAEVVSEGPCDDDCVCPNIYAPVCGVDGNTYGNACRARCAGVEVRHEGRCGEPPCRDEDDCPAGEICFPPTDQCQQPCAVNCFRADPVCGDDGVTYTCGEVDANCHGAEVVSEGPCDQPCICPHVFAPVCGDDGQTYTNSCFAQCAGTAVSSEGPCAPPACQGNDDCPQDEICFPPTQECQGACQIACIVADPVCGADGNTYGCGEIDANCHGTTVVHPGPCGGCQNDAECGIGQTCSDGTCGPCFCPLNFDPVCGVDGETYGNACQAGCAQVEVAFEGSCEEGCRGDDDCPVGDVCNQNSCDACLCPLLVVAPVCGVDGETYGNACEARCAHVEVAREGSCSLCRDDDECPVGELCIDATCIAVGCPAVFDPVCGVDGQTYSNSCVAQVNHVEVAHDGPCRCEVRDDCPVGEICGDGTCGPCVCPLNFDPVCGVDGKTYGNACEANCAHVEIRHDGECGDRCRDDLDCEVGEVCRAGECTPCVCPDVFDPVCGVDGETYGNRCEARCAHVEVKHEGECIPPICFEDSDEDGVPDHKDNCVRVPNPDQADLDFPNDDDSSIPGIQHYGDVCDKDFDDDGIVGASDFFGLFRPCIGADLSLRPACEEADCNGDGIVAPDDFFGFFRPLLGTKPGPGVTE